MRISLVEWHQLYKELANDLFLSAIKEAFMGRKSRIKHFRRELKQMGRKIQIVAEEHIPDGDQDQIVDLE